MRGVGWSYALVALAGLWGAVGASARTAGQGAAGEVRWL